MFVDSNCIVGSMKPEVCQCGAYEVETSDGTFIVPEDVVGYIHSQLLQTPDSKAKFFDYVSVSNSDEIEDITYHADAFIARLSMPGYLDCTDWTIHQSEKQAIEYLEELYGD